MCTPNYALERRPEVRRGGPGLDPGRHGLRAEARGARRLAVPDRARNVDLCGNQMSGHPTPSTRRRPRNSICAMALRFQAIDATLSPRPRRRDGG